MGWEAGSAVCGEEGVAEGDGWLAGGEVFMGRDFGGMVLWDILKAAAIVICGGQCCRHLVGVVGVAAVCLRYCHRPMLPPLVLLECMFTNVAQYAAVMASLVGLQFCAAVLARMHKSLVLHASRLVRSSCYVSLSRDTAQQLSTA